jgi:hypothetical protein
LAIELKGAIDTATIDRLRETLQRIVDHSLEARVITMTELLVPVKEVEKARVMELEKAREERESDESSEDDADMIAELEAIRSVTAVDVSAYVDSEDEAEYEEGLEESLSSKSKKRKRATDTATQHPMKRIQRYQVCDQCNEEYDVL